ncbi:MAG: peptidase S53 [Mycobacterium sp.]|nr:peptidase S53 [Mycobacterium sp.]
MTRKTRTAAAALAAVSAAALIATDPGRPADTTGWIRGPYAALLGSSTDLGPARAATVQVTAALRDGARPDDLFSWAHGHGLTVRWAAGQAWAFLEGPAAAVAGALGVDVHDYRGRQGRVFYASPQQPGVPAALGSEVTALGRILGYTPHHEKNRWQLPLEVPGQGLTPQTLLRTYNIEPLRSAGFTGKDATVVVFAFSGFDQADLDTFAQTFGLPQFTPEVVGGMPTGRSGEAAMDLQAVHAIAPDAKKVLVNARPTVEGDGAYEKIAAMMADTDRRYPGAVWSLSIGWGCDRLITAADLAPVRAALVAAQRNGTTAFDASGDLAGLECKGGQEWSSPPHEDNVGLDALASIPEMTSVGGTTLSTDADGAWLDETAWFDAPLSQGSAGGVSALYDRPAWQAGLKVDDGAGRRLTPDVAAVADTFTGVRIVLGQQVAVGGGTSLAAPLWAGIAAVINQYLTANGGAPLGNLNPLLYRLAEGARLPAFHDVVRGGNAVHDAGPGYDPVTGLGTPDVANLAKVLLDAQRLPL